MTRLRILLGVAGAVAAAMASWDLWGRFVQGDADPVPYTVLERDDRFERRQYPDLVVARTAAPDDRTAFRRLFRYIDGANEQGRRVPMTSPVATASRSVEIEMTAPVATTTATDGDVEMSFFLPASYTIDGAPTPTDHRVSLDLVEHREVAASRFSWFATDGAVRTARRRLERELLERGLDPDGEPELHLYDDPRTPPWQRRNELVWPLD